MKSDERALVLGRCEGNVVLARDSLRTTPHAVGPSVSG